MATAEVSQRRRDIEALVDLFLSSDFEPLKNDAPQLLGKPRTFEGDLEDVEDVEGDVADEEHDGGQVHDDGRNAQRIKEIGRKLAQSGDVLLRTYNPNNHAAATAGTSWVGVSKRLEDVFLPLAGKSENVIKQEKEEAYKKFKGIMMDSVQGTGVDDSVRVLGASLLVARGLSTLYEGTKRMVRDFFIQFIRDEGLDRALQ